MLYLAFIWHMHQPYYVNILNNEAFLPWVRLHGIKDYLDMVKILENFPNIHQTFNLVPSLIEQINSYTNHSVEDKFLKISIKKADSLNKEEKEFIVKNFFMADPKRILSLHPRYYELYLRSKDHLEFSTEDLLDLQIWFNLAWFDPYFRENIPELKSLIKKARFFTEEDKKIVLDKQIEILSKIKPIYKQYQDKGQIEISVTPYYHPILPLLYSSRLAKEANSHTHLPKEIFSYPQDCTWHLKEAVNCFKENFGFAPQGMWPSEQSVCNQIMPFLIEQGLNWIVTDEQILLKTMRSKFERSQILYQPYAFRNNGEKIHILFRDRNLSDLIGFSYQNWEAQEAVNDFITHLSRIHHAFKDKDCLVTIALDGENCWEYYKNDGWDFLTLLYEKISESNFIKTVTVSEYLKTGPKAKTLTTIKPGSWIHGDFNKWMGHPAKNKAWEMILEARKILAEIKDPPELAWKQMYILEGSDWFWWYGDKHHQFDELFRMHLKNFYTIIGKTSTHNLDIPLE